MKLFTDNIEYARQIFQENIAGLNEIKTEEFNPTEKRYLQDLYERPDILHSNIKYDDFWQNAFLVKFAQRSQFDTVRELSRQNINLPSASFFLADSGKGFHGFHQRRWQTKSGNIHLCVYLNPARKVERFHLGLMIIGTLSVIQTIDEIPQLKNRAQIRWLNDIFIEGGKAAGVLTYSQTQGEKVNGALIGIGLNVLNSPGMQDDGVVRETTALSVYCKVRPAEVFDSLLDKIKTNYLLLLSGAYDQLFSFYKERSEVIGKKVALYSDPVNGVSAKLGEDIVLDIKSNLELKMKNAPHTLKKGRIVILE